MKLSVIGVGYLGAVHAATMASVGHDVVAVDSDEGRVAALASGTAPFVEPGFDGLLRQTLDSGRLHFTADYRDVAEAVLHFIAVGTPQRPDSHAADLTHVYAAVGSLLPHIRPGAVVAGKSTGPVGTGGVLAWNPEFLREGFAVRDTLKPDRIVYGLSADAGRAGVALARLDECYAPMLSACPRLIMDFATAELIKVAANAFLATKISFINAVSQVCDAAGADVTLLAEAIGLDERIGRRFLRAGVGFGGGCLPKDIRAFRDRAADLGVGEALDFLADVDAVNDSQRTRAVRTVRDLLGGLAGRRIAVLGAAFKPDSDDVRTSPGLLIAAELEAGGASVAVTDPAAGPALEAHGEHAGEFVAGVQDAVVGADAVLLATEWEEYRRLDPARLAGLVRRRVVFDGRNALDPARWKAAGWTYRGVGRR